MVAHSPWPPDISTRQDDGGGASVVCYGLLYPAWR
jgi:hypothetical protein